jgi:hypothetical protein
MSKLSKSPERGTFQKEGYIRRAEEEGKEPNEDILNMWDNWNEYAKQQEQDPAWQKDNLEWDLRSTDWILEKARSSDAYAQNIYAALCNNEFTKREMWPILKDQRWSCTWRSAGGIVADMLGKGDYIDWYCSGMGGLADYDTDPEEWSAKTGYVPESTITQEIKDDLFKLGWIVVDSFHHAN